MNKKLVSSLVILLSSCFLISSIVKVYAEVGSSMEEAIIIKYTGDYSESIDQEYEYIENNFGAIGKDWVLIEQKLLGGENNRSYDELTIKIIASGEEKTLYCEGLN